MKDEHVETILGVGLALCGALILGGLGALILGALGGGAEHGAGHAEPPPTAGSVPATRHQQIGTASPR